MSADFHSASLLALYIVSVHILHTNTKSSTHWKLNIDSGKVVASPLVAESSSEGLYSPNVDRRVNDPMMDMLVASHTYMKNGIWRIAGDHNCYDSCSWKDSETGNNNCEDESNQELYKEKSNTKSTDSKSSGKKKRSLVLDCGRSVNSTEFDHLPGINNRYSHPHIAEPEVAMIFRTKSNPEGRLDVVQEQLRKAKKDRPKSSQVYNQIGNFWRIKGDTQRSIECFRKALHFSPNNSDVLLNLARVLFNLRYLDDAFELTRISLSYQAADQNAWLQHFTLGEILKAKGLFKDATDQFRHTLDLYPGFHPAQSNLIEIETNLATTDGMLTYYTLFIILLLVLGVLYGILASIDGGFEDFETVKTQRHFNRAMAMRSIKLGINPKLIRMRKQYAC